MSNKEYVVEYLTEKDNETVYNKKVFDDFRKAIRFCKKLWKDNKNYYFISIWDKKD